MRILVVTNLYPTNEYPYGGIFVYEQIETLRALGVDIDVLFINGRVSKLNYLKGIFQFWGKITARRYDLIHAHYVYSGWIARMQVGIPVVVTSHGSDTMGHEGWLLRRLRPLVDAMTITSKENQKRANIFNAHILPCGVDTDLFKPMNQAEARRTLGWDLTKKVMLYVGRDAPLKRLDILRKAHEIVLSHRPDVDLVLATNVNHNEIPLYMNAADVFVFASETEGAPVVIKEALACNLPVVSVDVGDVAEVIANIDNCYICERTPESVAEYALKVQNSGQRADGRPVVQTYSKKAIAQKLISIYREVLHRGSDVQLTPD